MSEEERSFEVPTGLEEEAKEFAALIREREGEGSALVVTAETEGFGVEIAIGAVIWLAARVVGKVTDSWVDDFVWPELSKRIETPSRRFAEWLKAVGSRNPS